MGEGGEIFNSINTIKDIRSIAFVLASACDEGECAPVKNLFDCPSEILRRRDEIIQHMLIKSPEAIFVMSDGEAPGEDLMMAGLLRNYGYGGIMMLVVRGSLSEYGGSPNITSRGYDNYIHFSDDCERMEDSITWSIINRKRRNKHSIIFDENPEKFFTIDSGGNVLDINLKGAEGSGYSPRDVVRRNINIAEIQGPEFFLRFIKPYLKMQNVGMVFTNTVEEGERIYSIKVRVHNVPLLGIVATVIKSDITTAMYTNTLDLMINSITLLSQRDNYTAAHSARVFYYCRLIVEAMGLGTNLRFQRSLYFAALLHDIGKIGIKDNILLKPGRLSEDEYQELMTHSVKGYKMLHQYQFLKESAELVLCHHEMPDGQGYPDKLRGSRIPFGSSIIAVADGFDAMTSTRPYRNPLPFGAAIKEIKDNLGTQFDEAAADAFVSVITPSHMDNAMNESRKPLSQISQEMVSILLSGTD